MWQFLYFLPLPHGHGSLRPTFCWRLRIGSAFLPSPLAAMAVLCWARMSSAPACRAPLACSLIVAPIDQTECWNASTSSMRNTVGADLVLEANPHRVEFLHALAFELGLRVDLGVADQADALFEVIHHVEMVLPAQVELLQEQAAFHAAHLGAVAGVEGVPQDVAGLFHA